MRESINRSRWQGRKMFGSQVYWELQRRHYRAMGHLHAATGKVFSVCFHDIAEVFKEIHKQTAEHEFSLAWAAIPSSFSCLWQSIKTWLLLTTVSPGGSMGLDHFLLLYTLVTAIRRSLSTDDERKKNHLYCVDLSKIRSLAIVSSWNSCSDNKCSGQALWDGTCI